MCSEVKLNIKKAFRKCYFLCSRTPTAVKIKVNQFTKLYIENYYFSG